MATQMEYAHKKFDTKLVTVYSHKKFGQLTQKRKRADDNLAEALTRDNKENIMPATTTTAQLTTIDEILHKHQQPAAKRRQTKTLFRPWLSNEKPALSRSEDLTTEKPAIQYHRNMARMHPAKPRTPKEQLRQDRNTISCLVNRQAKRDEQAALEQQLLTYRQQNAIVVEQQLRTALYLQYLMRLSGAPTAKGAFAMAPQYQQQQQAPPAQYQRSQHAQPQQHQVYYHQQQAIYQQQQQQIRSTHSSAVFTFGGAH